MSYPSDRPSPTNGKQSKKAGLPPGTLVHVGKKKATRVQIRVIDFDPQNISERQCDKIGDCFAYRDSDRISWINIDGIHDVSVIQSIGDHFGLHPLMLEDVMNTEHRPKSEEYENYLFVTLKMLGISKKGNRIVTEQVSMAVGEKWLLSFQEKAGDLFDPLRERLRSNLGLVRKRGSDYLMYRLLDIVVDNYFLVIEHVNDRIEHLEDRINQAADKQCLDDLQALRKQVAHIRRAIFPLREAVYNLQKSATNLIHPSTEKYLQDVAEHIVQLSDSVESQRDLLGNVYDLYQTGVSMRMNQIMQMLTIIATIFIPMTFIAGVYGMNFEYMPELQWKYSYFVVWGLMIAVFVGMLIYFRRKQWL